MIIRVNYQRKVGKVDIPNPLTYEKVTTILYENFGVPVEKQLLMVNNIEVTPSTDFSKLKTHIYPIVVKEMNLISVCIGDLAFDIYFYFGYSNSLLLERILDILRSSGYEVPKCDYSIAINDKLVDMNATVSASGATEGCTVSVNSSSCNLSDYFGYDRAEPEPQPQPEPTHELPVESIPEVESTPEPERTSYQPESLSPVEDQYITVQRRVKKAAKPVKTTALSEAIVADLKLIQSALGSDENGLKALQTIEAHLSNANQQLQQYESMVTDIHYENQMLREIYHTRNGKSLEENIAIQQNSWQRASLGNETLDSLPDDVAELKKLVNEKYATALMNERRFEKELKRSRKWERMAKWGGSESMDLEAYYTEYQRMELYCDEMKAQNLDLRERMRTIYQSVDDHNDEVRRLTETIQCRDETIRELSEKILMLEAMMQEQQERQERQERQDKQEEKQEEVDSDVMEETKIVKNEESSLLNQIEQMKVREQQLLMKISDMEAEAIIKDSMEKEEKDFLQKEVDEMNQQLKQVSNENEHLKQCLQEAKNAKEAEIQEDTQVIENISSILEVLKQTVSTKKSRCSNLMRKQ